MIETQDGKHRMVGVELPGQLSLLDEAFDGSNADQMPFWAYDAEPEDQGGTDVPASEPAMHYHERSADRGLLPDGRRLWVFSQSHLKAVEICPERGRRALLKLDPHTHTDSTALGESVHLAIELCVQSMIDGQGPLSANAMLVIAVDHFSDLSSHERFKWVKLKTAKTVEASMERCLDAFTSRVLPTLTPLATEQHVGPYTIHEDAVRVIQMEGTIDYIDAVTGPADWKTAGRMWDIHEHKRWDVQPTVYTWMMSQAYADYVETMSPWCWHVFYLNGEYDKIETTRGPGDWEWLRERVLGLALQLEADLPEWFKNPASWLCSAKYCDHFQACRGKHRTHDVK